MQNFSRQGKEPAGLRVHCIYSCDVLHLVLGKEIYRFILPHTTSFYIFIWYCLVFDTEQLQKSIKRENKRTYTPNTEKDVTQYHEPVRKI
jgi:L-asparagine transporter-like permease